MQFGRPFRIAHALLFDGAAQMFDTIPVETVRPIGTAAGTSTAAAEGSVTAQGDGASAGAGAASGDASAIAQATGEGSGTGSATGAASATAEGSGASSGSTSVGGTGSATAEGAGSSAGSADGTGTGASYAIGIGTSSGSATATGEGIASAPEITFVSPTPGVAPGEPGGFPANYAVAKNTPIVVNVTDEDPGLAFVVVTAKFRGKVTEETVYRAGAFRGDYVAYSTSTPITDGLQLSIRRRQGWPGSNHVDDVTISVDAVDDEGNVSG